MNIEQGSLREVTASALLLRIFEENRSGVLYLKRDEILKELYIDRGKLVWTASNSEVDTLENMLNIKKIVDAQTLEMLKKNTKNEIELGKALVEKGMMTLEELIEFSKIQMRKIVKSVLKWGDGVYYFSKDVPANTFINLEIDLRDFIHDFIKLDLDMGFIWKGIGSFQEIFVKSEDNKKIEKYNLSKPELELLDKFTGEVNVEVISLNFVGLPKEEILKTIYFFLLSELLVKIDKDVVDERMELPETLLNKSVNEDLNVENELDQIDQIDLDNIDGGDNLIGKDIIEKESEVLNTIASDKSEIGDIPPVSDNELSITDRMLQDLNKEKSVKKGKLFNIFLILVVLAIVISGGIFLLLDNGKDEIKSSDSGKVNPLKKTEKRAGTEAENSDKIPEKVDKEAKTKHEDKGKSIVEKRVSDSSEGKTVPKVVPELKGNVKEFVSPDIKKSPLAFFKSGDYITSGKLWREKLLNTRYKYSILLELDCLKESVKFAYKKIKIKSEFFILNHRRHGRACYLVLYGKYLTKEEAEMNIGSLPLYFRKQSNPPRALELSKYL